MSQALALLEMARPHRTRCPPEREKIQDWNIERRGDQFRQSDTSKKNTKSGIFSRALGARSCIPTAPAGSMDMLPYLQQQWAAEEDMHNYEAAQKKRREGQG
mmetsp:Transcript_31295/g.42378  ORF Transcript_31295/g.42378 Transcript_31295/m.42378 type:complete len:102 (+) Transcript_31295:649-954(+)